MVWRQLPKLVPAGSIPVSCSTEKRQWNPLPFFCVVQETEENHICTRGKTSDQPDADVGSRSSAARTLRRRRKFPSPAFSFIMRKITSAHKVKLIYLTCRGCRFAFEQRENLAPQAQIPV